MSLEFFLKEAFQRPLVFEKIKEGKPYIFIGYRWEGSYKKAEKLINEPIISDKPIFVTDDKRTWASPWMKNPLFLITMKIQIQNPKVCLNSPKIFEYVFLGEKINKWKKQGFDSIIWTTKNDYSNRQAFLLNPQKQIIQIMTTIQDLNTQKKEKFWKQMK